MLSVTKIYRDGQEWKIKGSSEVFNSREEALERAMSHKTKKTQKSNRGRKFVSQKLGMVFRSNWEIEFAELLTDMGIKWDYEPERVYFRGEKESYLYDFILPEYNCVVEVKGWMDKRSERRCKLFKKYYGHEVGFFLWMKEERELILQRPELLFTYLDIAEKERERLEEQRKS
jgi:extradiol dioxygenase family protein